MDGGEGLTQIEVIQRYLGLENLSDDQRWLWEKLELSWSDRWNKDGLFSAVGDHPTTIIRPGKGRGKGRPSRYTEAAVARLGYIVHASRFGLGAETIKNALRMNIERLMVPLCANVNNIRYVLARPIALVLNQPVFDQIDWNSLHADIWSWKERADELRKQIRKEEPDLSHDEFEERFETHLHAREVIPLSLYFDPQLENSDVFLKGTRDAKPLFQAIERIIRKQAQHIEQDWALIEAHTVANFTVRLVPSSDKHVVHEIEIREPADGISLVSYCASRLNSIRHELDEWLIVCQRCRKIVAVHQPSIFFCGPDCHRK